MFAKLKVWVLFDRKCKKNLETKIQGAKRTGRIPNRTVETSSQIAEEKMEEKACSYLQKLSRWCQHKKTN